MSEATARLEGETLAKFAEFLNSRYENLEVPKRSIRVSVQSGTSISSGSSAVLSSPFVSHLFILH